MCHDADDAQRFISPDEEGQMKDRDAGCVLRIP